MLRPSALVPLATCPNLRSLRLVNTNIGSLSGARLPSIEEMIVDGGFIGPSAEHELIDLVAEVRCLW